MENEIWKPIWKFEKYEVSNFGRIKSNQLAHCKRKMPNVILRQYINNQGFPWVCLYNNHGMKQRYVHRIVAHAFLGKPKIGQQVNHLDFNRNNNHISNLEYVTIQENTAHMVKHNRHAFGERSGTHKLTEIQVRRIFSLRKKGSSVRDIAKKFEIDWSHIYRILRREFWKRLVLE